ncbi:GNAT family N-acetyltransferase [Bradyrhizobium sp. AUGA SZCCT0042]|uniref:GNAT family N-acetyltransferase n=1 Tax=Bradyrhizobium sp. AUGA SZCCT0042 TaxID=2807651 RepID=UPI001BA930C0|nr:GNAT family N-acetyltransferase [Bradyrhizobium sp. AUGA SZCCT0042]
MNGKARKESARRYPSEWERHVVLDDNWPIFLRPVRPSDDGLIRDLFAHVSNEDRRLRFFDSIKEVSPALMNKLTRLDYSRAMAFVAIDESDGHTLGVVRLHTDEADETAEYAIVIRSDLKGRGLGWLLMQLIIEYAKSESLKRLHGEILQENAVMLKMCEGLGFEIKTNAEDRGLREADLIL